MKIRSTEIQELSRNQSEYVFASFLRIQGMLQSLSIEERLGHTFVRGKMIHTGYLYAFELEISEYGEILDHYCSCPHHENENGCRHLIALCEYLAEREFKLPYHLDVADEQKRRFKEYQTQLKKAQSHRRQKESHQWLKEEAFRTFTIDEQKIEQGTIHLCMELQQDSNVQFHTCRLGLRIQKKQGRSYIVRDLPQFFERIQEGEYHLYGKELAFTHQIDAFDEASQRILFFIRKQLLATLSSENKRSVCLQRYMVDQLALLLQNLPKEYCNYRIVSSKLRLKLQFSKQDSLISIILRYAMKEDGTVLVTPLLGQTGVYEMNEATHIFHRYEADENGSLFRLYHELLKEGELLLNEEDFQHFYQYYLCERAAYIEWEGDIDQTLIPHFEEKVELYLDLDEEANLCAKLEYVYEDLTVSAFAPTKKKVSLKAQAIKEYLSTFIERIDKEYTAYLKEDAPWNDIIGQLTKGLDKQCLIFISDQLRRIRRPRQLSLSVGVRMENDLLSLQMDAQDMDLDELANILKSYRRKKKYYRLHSGEMVTLDGESIKEVSDLFEQLQLTDDAIKEGKVTLPKYRLYNLETLCEEQTHVRYDRESIVKQQLQLERKETYDLPAAFERQLRDYQKIGYQWLKTLSAYGFGGLLADDMGLGKTIQILAYLQSEKGEGKQSLVVCPASLLLNWQDEANRFAKALRCMAVYGNKEERQKRFEEGKNANLLVTSYDYLKRDLAMYQDCFFDTVIIDEAQYISNPNTKNAKAVKRLRARQRFALSGTPIENTLTELWSIFDFLLPGYLYDHSYFASVFEKAIVKEENKQMIARLQKLVRPFLLRRSKAEVLSELPDKEEHTLLFEFERKERERYLANASMIRKQLAKEEKKEKNAIQILAMITRLRQLCQDARLVYENVDTLSSKLKGCMELIQSCIRAHKKILLFSSFTSMLELIGEELEKEGIAYYLLTGAVSKEKRHHDVEQFQKDETPIFLISLKAGGTGLNLTAAEVVIHFDPWWNLSAQNQATDRAYRIGQHNNVQVFQLIMKDTIEERIQELQAKKRDLADLFVATQDHNLLHAMSREELLELFM